MAIPIRACAVSAACPFIGRSGPLLIPIRACAVSAAGVLSACSSPFDTSYEPAQTPRRVTLNTIESAPASSFRDRDRQDSADEGPSQPTLDDASSPDDYVRYALFHSPEVESAYQTWRAASERLPQVSALPDPRLSVGFFLDEVETRTGAQQARLGMQQTFPWPGKLSDREDAAGRAAMASWRRFEGVRLALSERVVAALHELAYLDASTRITQENLDLLRSFEQVVRARYRVGVGSHPELVRAQVELGQLEDRLLQLRALRPPLVGELNALLNRDATASVPVLDRLPARVAIGDAAPLAEIARRTNPGLLALDEQIAEQRLLTEVARADGLPDLTIGLDYLVTDEASNSAIAESGDDPIMLTLGVNVPLWRDKYNAGVRETIARRLAVSSRRADEANRIASALHRAWFEHTDADRRVRLYDKTLIPKATESLRASLAGFRAGETSLLDLLDTERTLLEFAIASERARSERGKALARLHTLVGEQVPTRIVDENEGAQNEDIPTENTEEVRP